MRHVAGVAVRNGLALLPVSAALGADEAALGAAPPLVAPVVVPVLVPAAELLEPPELQALTAPARPTRPTPASRPRRVARVACCGSCVTSSPVPFSSSARSFCSVLLLPGYENGAGAGRVHGLP